MSRILEQHRCSALICYLNAWPAARALWREKWLIKQVFKMHCKMLRGRAAHAANTCARGSQDISADAASQVSEATHGISGCWRTAHRCALAVSSVRHKTQAIARAAGASCDGYIACEPHRCCSRPFERLLLLADRQLALLRLLIACSQRSRPFKKALAPCFLAQGRCPPYVLE